MLRFTLPLLTLALVLLAAACGADSTGIESTPATTGLSDSPAILAGPTAFPDALPADAVQRWETLTPEGYVAPAEQHGASALNADSEFVAGVERYLEGGSVADTGEATSLTSAAGQFSHAIYRIPLGGDEPGVVTVDANLTAGDGYFVGLADYGTDSWQWHGPFADNHVRLSTADTSAGADFSSPLGSVFVCVVAYDGAGADVVGIGVNPVDPADTIAPPAPGAPTATAVDGGLGLEWLPVVAGDLAGYRVYRNSQFFVDGKGTGVETQDSLEGLASHVLSNLSSETFVRISAVDISGNESALSGIASATPLTEAPLPLQVVVTKPSGGLGEVIGISATGADTYDFDTDGDGTYEITGDASGVASIDTSSLGVIRAGVRGSSTSGTSFARGGVSVIIAGNSRPVASASATPANGPAPLDVSFSGTDSTDFDGEIVGGGWDFDGDGTYDVWDDSDIMHVAAAGHQYATPGIYNAKLRVVDNEGAWDVDTVSILVFAPTGNIPPTVVLRGSQFTGQNQIDVEFSGADSFDPDGSIVDFEWDFDGNGVFNEAGAEADSRGDAMPATQTYTAGLPVVASLRVTDNDGATATSPFTISVHGWVETVAHSGTDVGTFPSLAIVDGNPAMAYRVPVGFPLEFRLHYIRATDPLGTAWAAPVPLDPDTGAGEGTTLLVIDGNPAICYRDVSNEDAAYIRATDAQGTSWGSPVRPLSAGSVGHGSSMAVVEGNPAICANGGNKLTYVRATDAQGTTWGTPVDADASATIFDSCLAVVDGRPAISYYSYGGNELRYVRATDSTGSGWDTYVVVDSDGDTGWNSSMTVVDGNPAISYLKQTGGDLMYARASDAQGATWATPVAVQTSGEVGSNSSLAVIDGYPAISYSNWVATQLLYVRGADPQGSTWGTPEVVNLAPIQAGYTSMRALPDGRPAIGYYNNTAAGLSFTSLY